MKKFLLTGLILLSVQCSYAKEDHSNEPAGTSAPAPRLTSQAPESAITWQEHLICGERKVGAILGVLGKSAAVTGSVMVLNSNPNSTEALVGTIMAPIGVFVFGIGDLLTSRADERAAGFVRLHNEEVKKITADELTQGEVDILSAQFYANLGCEGEMKCARAFDTVVGKTFSLLGRPLALLGFATSKMWDNTAGLVLSAIGGVMWELGPFFDLRAKKRNELLKIMEKIEATKKDAKERSPA